MDTFEVWMLTRVKIAMSIKLLLSRTSDARAPRAKQIVYIFKFTMIATDINPSKSKEILFYICDKLFKHNF